MTRLLRVGLASVFMLLAGFQVAVAAENSLNANLEKETVLSADQVTFNREIQEVVASGHVVIVQGERVMKADRLIYNVKDDTIRAEGNISLTEPTGDVLFADEMNLENELKTGAIKNIRVLFTDNSRLAAHDAIKVDENTTIMTRAVFSTCRVCEQDPDRPPLWQIKSEKVIHDRTDKTVTYRNAVLEFFNIPILYTPYFSHPDPSVDRESGFLAPSVFDSTRLGNGITIPYYYVISEDKDMTITPTITTKEGVQMAGEYRQAIESGSFQFDTSITYVDERESDGSTTGNKEFQGHIRGNGQFKLDESWLWGFDVFRTSNDTYLENYDISNLDTLTSTAYIQGQRGRNFSLLSAYSFQGLRSSDVSSQTPIVPAWWNYSYVGEPNKYGARFSADADTLLIFREDGQDTERLSMSGGWHLPYTTSNGQVFNFNTSLRSDLYYVRNQLSDPSDPGSTTGENSIYGRFVPSVSLEWKYPFVRQAGSVRQVIEPIVEAVWSEALGSKNTPNEDSLSFEFDDTNLFGSNRFAGLDEVEEGARLNYGLNIGVYGESGGYSTLLVGQSIHQDGSTSFQAGTGLEDQFSDYITRLEIRPSSNLQFINRTRIDHDKLTIARNEVYMTAGTAKNYVNLGYVYLRDDPNGITQDKREEIYLAGRVQLAEFWNAYGNYRRNLVGSGNSIDGVLGVEYLDECFGFALEASRSFTRDRDVQPETRFSIKIRLLPFN